MSLDPPETARAGAAAQRTRKRPGTWVGLVALLLLSGLSGCLGGEHLVGHQDPSGFVQVDVYVRSLGEAPQNVSALNLSFSRLSLFEQTTKQWVHVDPSPFAHVDLDGAAQPLGRTTMPRGVYNELEGTLERGAFTLDGEQVEARVLHERCRTSLAMDLTSPRAPARLTLFFAVEDVLGHDAAGWTVSPAFSGSLAQGDAQAQNALQGPPLLGPPRCPPEAPQAPSAIPSAIAARR